MLFTKKIPTQIILTSDILPDFLTQKQRMERPDIFCRYMPLSNRKDAGMGSSGSFLQNLHGRSLYHTLPLAFNPSLDGDLLHPSLEHGDDMDPF